MSLESKKDLISESQKLRIPETELKPGQSQLVQVDGKEFALFNVEGRLFAIDNKCPHRGGPLARGRLECTPSPQSSPPQGGEGRDEGEGEGVWAVRCPIHGWLFDLATGKCLNQTQARVNAYSVSCQDGEIALTPCL